MKRTFSPLAYSISEAAECLGISRPTVYVLIRAGKIRTAKVGARTLIRRVDLEDFLAKAAGAPRKGAQSALSVFA